MLLSHADWIRSLKAKKRIVNLLGLALGLGIFLVIAVIVAQKQVGTFEKVTHTDQKNLEELLIWWLKGEGSEGSILTAGEIFMRADNPADCKMQIIFTIPLIIFRTKITDMSITLMILILIRSRRSDPASRWWELSGGENQHQRWGRHSPA